MKGKTMILPYDWREKLKPSNLRTTINENSAAVSIVAAVIAVLAIVYIYHSASGGGGSGKSPMAYYYDTSTQQFYTYRSSRLPPLKNAQGKRTIVLAYMYTCASCKNRKIAWLEKYTKQARAALMSMLNAKPKPGQNPGPPPFAAAMYGSGILVRSPVKGSQWYPINSPQGNAIQQLPRCPSGTARICMPS
jgi:hypothetical protein